MKPEGLYPVVKTRFQDNDPGTGVIVASRENKEEEYETYVLTRYQWLEDAIEVEERFDSMIGEERKMETRSQVDVEIPTYKRELDLAGTRTLKGDIISYDEEKDLAIVKLDDISKYDRIAPIAQEEKSSLSIVRVAGSVSRFAAPFHLKGEIIGKGIREGDQTFNLVTGSQAIFDSGAVVLDEPEGEVLGILSGIETKFKEGEISSQAKLYISLDTIKEWLEEEFLSFIYNPEKDMEEEKKEREEYKKKETQRRLIEAGLSEPKRS